MENAQTENSTAGGASELTAVLERMRARADNAYGDYIGQERHAELQNMRQNLARAGNE